MTRRDMMRPYLRIIWLAVVTACGGMSDPDEVVDCSTVQGVDTFVVGLEHRGVGGKLSFALMSIDPAPAARGDNTWVVQVNRVTGGAVAEVVEGAALSVTPFMPAHMHGTPITAVVTPLAGGQYELQPVNLWMPGVWETTIQATSGNDSDRAVYSFCIQ